MANLFGLGISPDRERLQPSLHGAPGGQLFNFRALSLVGMLMVGPPGPGSSAKRVLTSTRVPASFSPFPYAHLVPLAFERPLLAATFVNTSCGSRPLKIHEKMESATPRPPSCQVYSTQHSRTVNGAGHSCAVSNATGATKMCFFQAWGPQQVFSCGVQSTCCLPARCKKSVSRTSDVVTKLVRTSSGNVWQ